MSISDSWEPAFPRAFTPLRGDDSPPESHRPMFSEAPKPMKRTISQRAVVETANSFDSRRGHSASPYTPATLSSNDKALPGWRPKSLRKVTFFTFALVSVGCIATLAALFADSRSHQGLLTVDTHLHYFWTYTPTLFFAIAGACWSRVVYRILQMQPWRMISESQMSIPEALFVDYVTPMGPISLFKAIKARHFLVATVLLSSIALQLVTVLSTSLFDVEYLAVRKNGLLSLLDNITGIDHDFSTLSAGPDLTIYSIQNTNLSYPEGTTSLYAVPKLSYLAVSNATLAASVDVYASYLQCELASFQLENLTLTSQTGGLHNGPQFTYSLSTQDCFVPNQTAVGGMYLDYNYAGDNFVFYDTYGNTAAVTCSNNDSDVQDVRIRISVGLIHYNITWNGTEQDVSQNTSIVLPSLSEMFQLSASTNLLCIPHYGLQTAEVTYTTNQTTGNRQVQVQAPNSTSLRAFEDVSTQAISEAIMESVYASAIVMSVLYPDPNAEVITVNNPSESEGGYFPTNADAFFTTMTQQYPPANGSSKSTWFDPQSLESASSLFFRSVAAQFASQYMRKGVNDTVPGTATIVEPRLVMLSAVFYVIQALLVFFALATLALAWPAARSITPIDPASIGGTTAMLCSHRKLIDHFRGTGSYSLSELQRHLLRSTPSGKRNSSRLLAFKSKRNDTDVHRNSAGQDGATWWRPLVLRPIFRETVLLFPLLAIIGLEITLHYSRSHNGLASIGSHRYKLYAARLVPALIFSAIRMPLTSLSFQVSLLTSFSTLRRGPSAAHFSLFDTPLARFPLYNLWSSVGKRQVALFCSVLVTSATFFMVTVSSGLFVTGDYTQSSNLTQLTWFHSVADPNGSTVQEVSRQHDLSEPLLYLPSNTETTVNLVTNSIIELNLSYPAWTYDELAFPLLAISNTSTTNVTSAVSISAQIPAVRADLKCGLLKNDEVNISYAGTWDASFGQNFTYQIATVSVPAPDCGQPVTFGANLPARLSTSREGSVAPRPCAMLSYDCSSLVGIYGYATDEAFMNYSVISCRAYYEQVQTSATLSYPNFVLSNNAPPIVDESTSQTLSGTQDVTDFLGVLFGYVAFYNTTETTFNGYATMDQVTSALIYGRDGVPVEQLFGYAPEEYLFPSLKHLIRVMGAQFLSYYSRTTNSSLPLVDSTIPATLDMGPNYRLKQNEVSTRILEALLAATWLFAVMTVFTLRSRDVVKAQLGSLAPILALVADSEFVLDLQRHAPSDTGERGEKVGSRQNFANIVQLEQILASEGYQFNLGWWGIVERRQRRRPSMGQV